MARGFEMSLGYEHPGLGDTHDHDPYAGMKLAVARWTGEILNRYYPGHAWLIETTMDQEGGLIKFRLNGLMPPDRWYCVQMNDALHDPSGHLVKRGAGEVLERYNIPRAGFDIDHWRTALNLMPAHAKMTGKGHLAPLLD